MKLVPKSVTRKVARKALTMKKNSPHIFFVAGVAGAIGSTVLACRATLKVSETLDTLNADVEEVKGLGQSAIENPRNSYGEDEYYKDLGYVYAKGTVGVMKLYAPAIVLGTASIAMLTGSHVTLTRRNAALTATVGMISSAFDSYRSRVREQLGNDAELHLYHNTSTEEIKSEEGKKELVSVVNEAGFSPYARFFDAGSVSWRKDAEYNLVFLQLAQNYFNQVLTARGHVFLNEVYDHLGIERTPEGQVVGWVLDGDDIGDGYIDFGIFEARNKDFVRGDEPVILLDFNVDGVVYERI